MNDEKSIAEVKAELRRREIEHYRECPDEPMQVVIRIRELGGVVRWPDRA